MSSLIQQSEPVVEKLLKADENQLFEQLGIRAKAVANDPTLGASFDPQVVYSEAQMGIKEDVREFGQRLFKRWDKEAYKMICGSNPDDRKDREELVNAFGVSDVAVAAALSALIVTQLGMVPALAAVLAALVVKRFFRPAHEEFCRIWKKHLTKN